MCRLLLACCSSPGPLIDSVVLKTVTDLLIFSKCLDREAEKLTVMVHCLVSRLSGENYLVGNVSDGSRSSVYYSVSRQIPSTMDSRNQVNQTILYSS